MAQHPPTPQKICGLGYAHLSEKLRGTGGMSPPNWRCPGARNTGAGGSHGPDQMGYTMSLAGDSGWVAEVRARGLLPEKNKKPKKTSPAEGSQRRAGARAGGQDLVTDFSLFPFPGG